jgi:WD40 repeat protein
VNRDCEDKQEDQPSEPRKMTPATTVVTATAEAIIHHAADLIGIAANDAVVETLFRRMKEEHVKESWQLEFIDSFQWEKLGAPIGLVAAIRNVISQQHKMQTRALNPGENGDESNALISGSNKRSSDGIGESNAEAAPKKSRPTQPGNDANSVAFRSFTSNFFHRLAVKLVDKGADEERVMAWVDSLPPEIPPIIFVEHILPMLPDRKSWNSLRSASKEIHNTSKGLIENGKFTPPWPLTSFEVTSKLDSVAFSPDGALLAYGGDDGIVRIWNGRDGQYTQLEGHAGGFITCLAFSTDGTILASASKDKTIRLWTLADRSCRVLEGHGDWVTSVAFSKDGLSVAGGCLDGSSRIWNAGSCMCTRVLSSIHISYVRSIGFSPDGGLLVSAGGKLYDDDDGNEQVAGRILLWDISGENDIAVPTIIVPTVIDAHEDEVNAIAYSPDGRYLASGGDDCTVKVWNIADNSCAARLQGHTVEIWSVCFSPNSKILASGSSDGSVRLWNGDACDGSCLVHLLSHHRRSVHSIAFSPNGRTLASGGTDRTVRLWNPNEQKQMNQHKGAWDKLILLWNLPT